MLLGVGAAPQEKSAPKTATFTLCKTNSLLLEDDAPSEGSAEARITRDMWSLELVGDVAKATPGFTLLIDDAPYIFVECKKNVICCAHE